MNIFDLVPIISKQSQQTQYWITMTLFLFIPFAIILISAIARIFCKKTLIVTGAVFASSLLIYILFFRREAYLLICLMYYFASFLGCFVTLCCEGILYLVNKKRGKVDVDAYGRKKSYSSGALQGKKNKPKSKKS